MITDERKGALMADLEASINKYLDKQWVIADAIDNLTENEEETRFLHTCDNYFAVMLSEKGN